ncbi:AAA family ATPase [Planococcus lenghuensis]|uniref:AAA family ATPase n=1 Tax=Planococcus lenghuensis TaxID=2213202 RepID=A0A1Q2L576_9BACL|nr:AAA family ATPase [Planococcus lenghuensis]AQQ55052.1 AAA family ATPase [Planococcus lenghuensis]
MLKRIILLHEKIHSYEDYPLNIPAIRQMENIEINESVTFFVGENGSGKSTLLEAIADHCGFNLTGGSRNDRSNMRKGETALEPYVRLSWMPKLTNGFFLRAESFFNFASDLDRLQAEEPGADVFKSYGGKSLHAQSHGESFLSLFTNRFGERAIYLLDEPEAALSPARQLALLKVIHDLTADNRTQFIIATHSPILLGYPGAAIFDFDQPGIREIAYEETAHYKITKQFPENREQLLAYLFAADEED